MLRLAFIFVCLATNAFATDSMTYKFKWQGGGGYVIEGAMAFPAELSKVRRVTEHDLSCFEINGYKDGEEIGRWALGMLDPDTTWQLSFDPLKQEFLVYGQDEAMPQAWNMDGGGYNCGDEGFGFNIGSAAQDICIDGQLIFESQVPPPQPFPVQQSQAQEFGPNACRPTMLLGGLVSK